jgi:Xaa-Pro aminopeptidase
MIAPLDALRALQAQLKDLQIDAYWVPSVDEHLNEYLPPQRKRREHLTGFDGSAGDLLVTPTHAYLLVDSRYHEQVDLQVNLSAITPIKLGKEGQATSSTGLLEHLVKHHLETSPQAFKLGFDPAITSIDIKNRFLTTLLEAHANHGVVPKAEEVLGAIHQNLVDKIYQAEAQAMVALTPEASIFPLPKAWTGRSLTETLLGLQEAMKHKQEGLMILTKLDQIAWVTQLRGEDIPYNPVFHAYMVITPTQCHLFLNEKGLTPEARTHLQQCHLLSLEPYETFFPRLKLIHETIEGTLKAAWVPSQYPVSVERLLDCREKSTYTHHPIDTLKGIKNEAELTAMRRANRLASRAKYTFIQQLKETLAQGIHHTEASAAEWLMRHYEALPEFHSLSFNIIAGYQHHGAIVHYGTPSQETCLTGSGLFLIDSGCQVAGGTTDKTRTIAIGQPTPKMKHVYTTVLKAHIRAAMQRFPIGTTGVAIDAIARSALWQQSLNYGHGTGHGVGAFLNVHEGPHGIHARTQVALQPGMITSIEPGYYEAGWGGVRLENLYEVVACDTRLETSEGYARSEAGWLTFRSLTWIPFDTSLIEDTLLTYEEKAWLETYHATCHEVCQGEAGT